MSGDNTMNEIVERMSKGPSARHLSFRRVTAGQMIRGSDDETEADGLVVVRSGCLRAFVSCDGRELTLFLLGPGDATRVHAGSMLEARRDGEIVFVPMRAIREFAKTDPELVLWAMPVFDRMLERSIRLIEDMAFHDVKHRLIRVLCDTADREGRTSEDGVVLSPPPNAEDFAMQIGATRQSVSTVMAELVRCGILQRFGQQSMVISDLGRLRRQIAPMPDARRWAD